jgi:hypothetical protein
MRDDGFTPIWQAWEAGGPFVGDAAPCSRVTVEKDWWLNLQMQAGSYQKCPIRWFQRIDNSQVETEIPNIKSVSWDRSLDTDAASLTLTIYNTLMLANDDAGSSQHRLGKPGAFTWRVGNAQAVARWGEIPNAEWENVIVVDALLRTYQGYGGREKTLEDAIADGNLALSGVWLIDEVRVKTDATIEVKARDMAKLLIEQPIYPPLVPARLYPHGLRYCRYQWDLETTTSVELLADTGTKRGELRQVGASQSASSDMWGAGATLGHPVHDARMAGHYPHEAFDGNPETYWLSTGNDQVWEPYAVEWIEIASGDYVDTVTVYPWAGNYRCYVSVMQDGAWVDPGNGLIPYDPLTVGRYTGDNAASIPWVVQVGIPWEEPIDIHLGQAFKADKVRVTFTNLYRSAIGPFPYRAGVRELSVGLSSPVTDAVSQQGLVQHDGNYRDYADIITELALWAGFYAFDPADPNGTRDPHVYGNIETTGIADTGSCVTEDQFDKKPVIDAMHIIRDIVGYWIWVDEEGGFHFESPNWFKSGNFRLDGTMTELIPDIDERVQLTDYSVNYADKSLRSEIIIASDEPTAGFTDTVATFYDPWSPVTTSRQAAKNRWGKLLGTYEDRLSPLRGQVRPMMLLNGVLTNPADQLVMAKRIQTHIQAATFVGSLTCAANPCIGLNDQIRIHEQITAETGIHYVKSISMQHDLDSGSFTMTMTTFRLGDDTGFEVTP